MAYVASHYRSKAISRAIGTSPKTIDAQIASACRKLGASDRDAAVGSCWPKRGVRRLGKNP